jgi:hypothetical protein
LFAGACQKVAGQMKNAIREYLYPHVPERLALDETHQMRPLQNLVQQDAVKESEAEDECAAVGSLSQPPCRLLLTIDMSMFRRARSGSRNQVDQSFQPVGGRNVARCRALLRHVIV